MRRDGVCSDVFYTGLIREMSHFWENLTPKTEYVETTQRGNDRKMTVEENVNTQKRLLIRTKRLLFSDSGDTAKAR